MQWWEQLDGPVLGRYRLDRLLGEGGMARVFLATDVRADRPVAFKTPKIESFPPDSLRELLSRFAREFRSQAAEPVQGVIPMYESGEFTDADGVVRPFLAMQYLSGGSLGDQLGGTIGRRERTQTLAEVLDWLVPIARTVDRLHARGWLHRDIKPDNILFNGDGDPFLADLGIVGTLDPSLGGSTIGSTSLGVLGSPGSPGYQSPESIQADPALRNISSSDQFSLAVTVYEALSGRLPANASTNHQWYAALVNWQPIPLSVPCTELPAAAVAAVRKAMGAAANERFGSCSEFAKALAAAAERAPAAGGPSVPMPAASASPSAAPGPSAPMPGAAAGSRPRRGPAFVAALVAVALAAPLAWFVLRDDTTSDDSAAATDAAPAGAGEGAATAATADTTPAAPQRLDITALGGTEPHYLPRLRFDLAKTDLTPESKLILDEAVAVLGRNPERLFMVEGRADFVEGSDELRKAISVRRARAAYDYLLGKGVAAERLQFVGYGSEFASTVSPNPDGSPANNPENRQVALQPMDVFEEECAAETASTIDTDGDNLVGCDDQCPDSDLRDPVLGRGCEDYVGSGEARFTVLFGAGDATLAPAETALLDNVILYLQEEPLRTLNLFASADLSEGSDSETRALTERRNAAIVDYLASRGIERTRITPQANGVDFQEGGTYEWTGPGPRPAFARNRSVMMVVHEPSPPEPGA